MARARSNQMLTVAAVVAVLGFAAVALILYRGRPTPGAVFLVVGWMAILATGYFLARAVSSFDLATGGSSEEIQGGRRGELEREKKLLLKAIKEVEFDRDMNKIDDADAKVAITRYRVRALEIIALLDDRDRPIAQRIDEELKKRLARTPEKAPEKAPEPAPEAAPAAARAAPKCDGCGLENDADATFCKRCGKKVAA